MFFLPLYPPNDPPLIILKINSEYIIQRLLLCPQAPRTNVPTSKALLSKKKKRRRSKHKKKHTIQYEIGGDSRFFLFTFPVFFFLFFFFLKLFVSVKSTFFSVEIIFVLLFLTVVLLELSWRHLVIIHTKRNKKKN